MTRVAALPRGRGFRCHLRPPSRGVPQLVRVFGRSPCGSRGLGATRRAAACSRAAGSGRTLHLVRMAVELNRTHAALRVERLTKIYSDDTRALDALSLEI